MDPPQTRVPGFRQEHLLICVVHQLHAAVWSHLKETQRDSYPESGHLCNWQLQPYISSEPISPACGDRTCCVHRSSTISAAPFTKSLAHISPSRLHMQVKGFQ